MDGGAYAPIVYRILKSGRWVGNDNWKGSASGATPRSHHLWLKVSRQNGTGGRSSEEKILARSQICLTICKPKIIDIYGQNSGKTVAFLKLTIYLKNPQGSVYGSSKRQVERSSTY